MAHATLTITKENNNLFENKKWLEIEEEITIRDDNWYTFTNFNLLINNFILLLFIEKHEISQRNFFSRQLIYFVWIYRIFNVCREQKTTIYLATGITSHTFTLNIVFHHWDKRHNKHKFRKKRKISITTILLWIKFPMIKHIYLWHFLKSHKHKIEA